MTEPQTNCHGYYRASSPSDVKTGFFFSPRITSDISLRLTERTSGSHPGYQGYDGAFFVIGVRTRVSTVTTSYYECIFVLG